MRRALPTGQTHVFLSVISSIHNDFCRCLAVNGEVQLVLNRRKKAFGRLGRCVVVERGRVDVGDLLVELPLGCADFPNFFQLPLEEFIRQNAAATLQALRIHDPPLNRVILDNLVGPLAELYGAFVFNLESHGDDGLQAVVIHLALNFTLALGLNH